eukprot:4467156-Pleurochrysis_carterae.AAC.1
MRVERERACTRSCAPTFSPSRAPFQRRHLRHVRVVRVGGDRDEAQRARRRLGGALAREANCPRGARCASAVTRKARCSIWPVATFLAFFGAQLRQAATLPAPMALAPSE